MKTEFKTVISIVAIILIVVYPIAYTELRLAIEPDNTEEKPLWVDYLEVYSELFVYYAEGNPVIIELGLYNATLERNNDSELIRASFDFYRSNLGLIANWSYIHLWFKIGERAFLTFPRIDASFFIEDNQGIIRKYDFMKSTENFKYYIGKKDISSFMWQDSVPDVINANVVFSHF